MIQTVRNHAPVTDLSHTFTLRNRDRNCRLMDIQSDECVIEDTLIPCPAGALVASYDNQPNKKAPSPYRERQGPS